MNGLRVSRSVCAVLFAALCSLPVAAMAGRETRQRDLRRPEELPPAAQPTDDERGAAARVQVGAELWLEGELFMTGNEPFSRAALRHATRDGIMVFVFAGEHQPDPYRADDPSTASVLVRVLALPEGPRPGELELVAVGE